MSKRRITIVISSSCYGHFIQVTYLTGNGSCYRQIMSYGCLTGEVDHGSDCDGGHRNLSVGTLDV